jgi:biopolymer transport protein ExbD
MLLKDLLTAVLPKHTRSVKLFCNIDASPLAAVLFVLLVVTMIGESAPRYGYGPELPHIGHAVSMPGALREDAMVIVVMRDGSVYFGADKVIVDRVPTKIQHCLKDRTVERKVYIRADGRAWYGTVKDVLDGVRAAGVEKVGFLLEQPFMGR